MQLCSWILVVSLFYSLCAFLVCWICPLSQATAEPAVYADLRLTKKRSEAPEVDQHAVTYTTVDMAATNRRKASTMPASNTSVSAEQGQWMGVMHPPCLSSSGTEESRSYSMFYFYTSLRPPACTQIYFYIITCN